MQYVDYASCRSDSIYILYISSLISQIQKPSNRLAAHNVAMPAWMLLLLLLAPCAGGATFGSKQGEPSVMSEMSDLVHAMGKQHRGQLEVLKLRIDSLDATGKRASNALDSLIREVVPL
jgi:hypothetical protein